MLREPPNERHCAYADGREWRSWAGHSFGTPERIYFPDDLPRRGGSKPRAPLAERLDLARLRNLVVDAEQRGKQVHVVGSSWSYSNVAFTSGYLVSTQAPGRSGAGLDQILPIGQLHLSDEVRRGAVFAHGGCHVSALLDHLDAPGSPRTLITVGGTAGDTLAGVISTGVHGSQPHQTPLSDSVLALLVIAEEGKLYWVQRADGPIASGDVPFDGFDGEVVSDDEVMNAAVLSLGCFGIIYAALVRTEPLYWLAETCRDRPLEGDFRWLSRADELGTALADPENDYVEVVMNPHAGRSGVHTGRFTTRSPVSRRARLLNLRSVSENARLLATFGDAQLRKILRRPSFVSRMPACVDQAIEVIRPVRSGRPIGRCHDFMGRELPPLRMAACEVTFPRARTQEMIAAIVGWARRAREGRVPFVLPGALALRYTKPSRATLSMHGERMEGAGGASHDTAAEIVCVQAVHGADRTRGQLLDCVDELIELGGVPHWGLIHRPSRSRTLEMYGEAKLASWRRAYRRLNPHRPTFENDYARDAGLCG